MRSNNTIKEVPLSRGLVALVDDADYSRVMRHKWSAALIKGRRYAVTSIGVNKSRRFVLLHRFILKAPAKSLVDHVDGNGLNCLRYNIRLCTKSENGCNRDKQRNNTSGYKGVSWDKDARKWSVGIQVRGKRIRIGRYVAIEDAARAYDAAARVHHREFAVTNFPE